MNILTERHIVTETKEPGNKDREEKIHSGATKAENLKLSLCLTLINQTSEPVPQNY